MKTFKEILKAKVGVDVEFVDLIQDESLNDGSMIIKLVLKNTIPVVYGRKITDRVSGEQATLQASDVELISLGQEVIDELDALEAAGTPCFVWEVEGKSGKLTCPLKLDVSNALDVWIVKTSFASFGRSRRNEATSRRQSSVINRINEAKAKREFKDTDVSAAPKGDEATDKEETKPEAKPAGAKPTAVAGTAKKTS